MPKTPLELQAQAIDEAGGSSINAVFEFSFMAGTNGGSFSIEINGVSTPLIPFGASALSVQLALCGLVTVGAGGCKVAGPKGGPYEIEMIGENAGQNVALPVVDGSQLMPFQEVQVELLVEGETNDFTTRAASTWDDITDSLSSKHRFLLVKLDLIEFRLGKLLDAVDHRTGQVNVTERKENQRYTNMLTARELCLDAIDAEVRRLTTGRRRSFGGPIQKTTPNGLPYGMTRRNPFTGRPQ